MDWEKEFRYLAAARTRPSADDLYNSLRTSQDLGQLAPALAELFVVTFDRIIGLESPPSSAPPDGYHQLKTLRIWLGRISTAEGYSAEALQAMARDALAGVPCDYIGKWKL